MITLTQCWYGEMPYVIKTLTDQARSFAINNNIGYKLHLFDEVEDPIKDSDCWRIDHLSENPEAWYCDCDYIFNSMPTFESDLPYTIHNHNVPHYSSIYCNGRCDVFKKLIVDRDARGYSVGRYWPQKMIHNMRKSFSEINPIHLTHLWYTTGNGKTTIKQYI